MNQAEADPVAAYIVAQTAAGDVADFTTREGYSADNKPSIKANFLRELLLGRVEGAKILRPGVRIVGVRVEGVVDLRDCAGDGLAALCLEKCDFDNLINLADSRVARLSLLGSRIRALLAQGLSADGNVDLTSVTPFPSASPIALIDLRRARIGGSVDATDCELHALTPGPNSASWYSTFALDLTLATVAGAVTADRANFKGGAAFSAAEIGGTLQLVDARFVSAKPGGYALSASAARVGGAVLLEGSSASGIVDFISAQIGGTLQCARATFANEGGDALTCYGATIGGALLLSNLSAKGRVAFADARIEGAFECFDARFDNNGSTALSANGAHIGRGVYFGRIIADGTVSLTSAKIQSGFSIFNVKVSHLRDYALNLETARIEGDLQAFDNTFQGAVTLAGAWVERLYDIPDTAWAGASAIELNELNYKSLSPRPWFFFTDSPREDAPTEPKRSAKRPVWQVRADWLKRNTGTIGKEKCPFSNQPWRECAAALARSGHHADARRLTREEQREAGRQRSWWKQPFVWLFAEQAFGFGLSVTRATVTSLLFWLVGWAGAEVMLQRGILVDMRDPQNVKICTTIDPAVYALDVAIPVLDLREESACPPGRQPGRMYAQFTQLGALTIDEVRLWRWIKALYAIMGAVVIGFTILTYSGVFKPKADA